MSVTLKLADDDAALVGRVLGAVGKAAIKVRNMPEDPQIAGTSPETARAVRAKDQAKALGNLVSIAVMQPFAVPDELVRIAAAFDTAVYANEAKR